MFNRGFLFVPLFVCQKGQRSCCLVPLAIKQDNENDDLLQPMNAETYLSCTKFEAALTWS